MKIAIITDVYYPYVKGGVEKRISEIANKLRYLSKKGRFI